jgi:hypothetical protein
MRYWNIDALLLLLIGISTGVVGWFVLSALLGDGNRTKGILALLIGCVVTAVDTFWRYRRRAQSPRWWLVSQSVGGTVFVFPGWILGLWIVGTGIAFLAGAK